MPLAYLYNICAAAYRADTLYLLRLVLSALYLPCCTADKFGCCTAAAADYSCTEISYFNGIVAEFFGIYRIFACGRGSETGRCALKPSVLDLASSFFSLIPIGFFVMLILSLLACAVGSLYIAGLGFVYALAE